MAWLNFIPLLVWMIAFTVVLEWAEQRIKDPIERKATAASGSRIWVFGFALWLIIGVALTKFGI